MNAIEEFLGIETPADLGAEQAVLGAFLLENDVIHTVK